MSNSSILVFTFLDGSSMVGEARELERFSNKPSAWSVKRPLKELIIPVPAMTPNGPTISLQPQLIPAFAMTGRHEFEISLDKLLFDPIEAPKGVQSAWIQATSGIQVSNQAPASNIII